MYTANTMSTAIEAMGLCLPGSSSNPAESPAKMRECEKAAGAIKICMEKNILPRDLLTKESFENALVLTMALGYGISLLVFLTNHFPVALPTQSFIFSLWQALPKST
jgi:dihydroxyacid dehydratase/phosphogluconate dehydratase